MGKLVNRIKNSKRFKRLQYVLLLLIVLTNVVMGKLWIDQIGDYDSVIGEIVSLQDHSKTIYYYNKSNLFFNESQILLSSYMIEKDENILKQYNLKLSEMSAYIDSLQLRYSRDFRIKDLMQKKITSEQSLSTLKEHLDSLLENMLLSKPDTKIREINPPKIDVSNILESIEYDTTTFVQEAKKKGFFRRIGDAIAGKNDTLAEVEKIVVTLKYGDKNVQGGFKDQIEYALKSTQKKYRATINDIKASFNTIREREMMLLSTNLKILVLANKFFDEYNRTFLTFQKKSNIDLNKNINAQKRTRRNVYLITFMLFITVGILFVFLLLINSRYEQKLEYANQKIRENLRLKDKIVSLISHDIRGPLSIMAIYLEKLKKKHRDAFAIKQFDILQHATNNSLELSNQILEMSKINSTQETASNSIQDIKQLLDTIFETMKELVENSGNTIVVQNNIPDNLKVYIDANKVSRLYYNLVGNSVRFTKGGTIKIITNIEKKDGKCNFLSAIQDNGIGIPSEILPTIFDSQKNTKSDNHPAQLIAGIGLSICKEIVLIYDGNISIKSKEGAGTEVSFSLKLPCG